MRRAVILNDTRGHAHFGCFRVMEKIEQELIARGFEIAARSLVRQKWWENQAFVESMRQSHLIVINGEGTLHHGSRHGPNLLKIAEHPARANKPIALVNALYQENPPEWKRYLDRIDYLNTRDTRSARELEQAAQREVRNTLDLSLCSDPELPQRSPERSILGIGDSVIREARASLVRLARRTPNSAYLPIVRTIKSSKPQFGPIRYALREAYIRSHTFLFRQSLSNAVFCRDHREYCDRLRSCCLYVTGRFHGVCLSLATNTPFIGLSSNSWKVEALLDDVGLSRKRLMNPDQLGSAVEQPNTLRFTDEEQDLLEAARLRAQTESVGVFDEIAALT